MGGDVNEETPSEQSSHAHSSILSATPGYRSDDDPVFGCCRVTKDDVREAAQAVTNDPRNIGAILSHCHSQQPAYVSRNPCTYTAA